METFPFVENYDINLIRSLQNCWQLEILIQAHIYQYFCNKFPQNFWRLIFDFEFYSSYSTEVGKGEINYLELYFSIGDQ